MKKSLLLSVALMGGLCAYAQIDITPANYKFATATEIPWYFNTDDETTKISDVNILGGNVDVYGNMNFKDFWNDGLWVLTSGGQNATQQAGFRNGWSIIDMGGEVGKVACFAGKASGIVDVLNDYAPELSSNWDAVKVDEESTEGWQLHMWMDPATCPDAASGYIHVKLVFNVFSANAGQGRKVFQNIGLPNNNTNGLNGHLADGKTFNPWTDSAKEENTIRESDCILRKPNGDPVLDRDENTTWDPTVWITYEFDQNISAPDDTGVYTPGRLRLNAMNGAVWNDYAFFLKEVSFTQMDGYPTGSNITISKHTLTPFISSDGVEAIGVDLNAPVEYYNLQGVKVVNPEKGIYIKKQGNKAVKVVL